MTAIEDDEVFTLTCEIIDVLAGSQLPVESHVAAVMVVAGFLASKCDNPEDGVVLMIERLRLEALMFRPCETNVMAH